MKRAAVIVGAAIAAVFAWANVPERALPAGAVADSGFHRALHVSYPAPADRARAAAAGVAPGGDIMVHGLPNGLGFLGRAQRFRDWTAGCIALTDREVDELWRAVPAGTPIEIKP